LTRIYKDGVYKMKKMLSLGCLTSLLFLLLTCAPITETQKASLISAGEEVEKELTNLSKVNPVLVEELRRLPELKRGLNEKGVLALKRIITFYSESPNPDEVKQIFDKILSVGKREYRKFSVPLQALLWTAEENELPLGQNPLAIFSKEKHMTFNLQMYGPDFRYVTFNKNLDEDEDVITFVTCIWKKTYTTDKWKDPNEIINRLNSPYLFDLFLRDNIRYDWEERERHRSSGFYLKPVKETIKSRKGVCTDATNFAIKALGKAGYKVTPLKVYFKRPGFDWAHSTSHTVGVLEESSKLYKIADVYLIRDGIVGPFKSIKEIAEKVAESLGTVMEDYSLSLFPKKGR